MSLKVLMAAAGFSAAVLVGGSALAQGSGEDLYKQNCAACHQPDGKGFPGAFPPLAGNPFVLGPGDAVATVVLNGRGGMPSFREELSRPQIADILTYVRSAWGNMAVAVTEATVSGAPGGGAANKPDEPILGFH